MSEPVLQGDVFLTQYCVYRGKELKVRITMYCVTVQILIKTLMRTQNIGPMVSIADWKDQNGCQNDLK